MTAVREAWTDERLDDLQGYMRDGFREVRGEIAQLRGEVTQLRGEVTQLRGEVTQLRGEVEQVKADMADLREEMRTGFARVAGEIGELRVAIAAIDRHLQIQAVLFGALFAGLMTLVATRL